MNVGDKVIVKGVWGVVHAINSDESIVVEFVGSTELMHFAPAQVHLEPPQTPQQPKSKRVR